MPQHETLIKFLKLLQLSTNDLTQKNKRSPFIPHSAPDLQSSSDIMMKDMYVCNMYTYMQRKASHLLCNGLGISK